MSPRTVRLRVSSVSCSTSALRPVGRSEEHTSELQSQSNLVCRLLLEKKKNKQIPSAVLSVDHAARQVVPPAILVRRLPLHVLRHPLQLRVLHTLATARIDEPLDPRVA